MAKTFVGVDIVAIARMEKALERTPAFARRIFTETERLYCERKVRPQEHYAARFAAREAVLKALGIGFSQGVGLQDISVDNDEKGKPFLVLTGRVKEIVKQKGIEEIALSLSCTREVAVANVVAVTKDARPELKKDSNPKEQLAQSFKDVRSILDELDTSLAQNLS